MSESIAQVLTRVRPLVESKLAEHRVPPEEAEKLLGDLLRTFCLKRNQISHPEAWLIAALTRTLEARRQRRGE